MFDAHSDQAIEVTVADDNAELRGMVGDFIEGQPDLELLGSCGDGVTLLDCLREEVPDVLILDVIMPGLDGISVLEWIIDNLADSRPAVLILSAFGQEDITRRAGDLGADYFLLKPFDFAILARRIRELGSAVPVEGSAGVSGVGGTGTRQDPFGEVTRLLRSVGVPPNVRGYRYLREAILRVIEDPDLMEAVTKELYPAVGSRFNTTAARVERAMRHAIESAHDRGSGDLLGTRFGYAVDSSRGKPTNSEFIALIADLVSTDLDAAN